MLDISDVNLIKTVAELRSINKAAEVLNIAQSTLSKKLGRLEQVLNIPLFYRDSAGMSPTEAALYIIERGQRLTLELNAIERHVELMANLETGELNVGVGPITEQVLLPKVLLDFIEETDNTQISLKTDSPQNLIDLLNSGEMDIVLGFFPESSLSENLIVTPVQRHKIINVARPDHPLLSDSAPVDDSRLAEFPLIAPQATREVFKGLRSANEPNVPRIVCDSYAIAKQVVMASECTTGGPEIIFRRELEDGVLVKIDTTIDSLWEAHSVIRVESAKVPLVNKFLDILNRYSQY